MRFSKGPAGNRVSNAQMNSAQPASDKIADIETIRTFFWPLPSTNMAEHRNKNDVIVKPRCSTKMMKPNVMANRMSLLGMYETGSISACMPKSASPARTVFTVLTRKTPIRTISMVPTKRALTCAVHGTSMMVTK